MRILVPRVVHGSLRLMLLLSCSAAGIGVTSSTDQLGFIPNHAYDNGPADSIDLYTLNPIVSQPLSPNLMVGDTVRLAAGASYGGFSWGRSISSGGGEESIFYLGVSTGVVGAGWRFGPGRVWRHQTRNTQWSCDEVRSVF